jgi:hypothetical protein
MAATTPRSIEPLEKYVDVSLERIRIGHAMKELL